MVHLARQISALPTTLLTLVALASSVIGAEVEASNSEVQLVSYESPAYPSPTKNFFSAEAGTEALDGNKLRDESFLTWSTEIESTYLRPSINGDSKADLNYQLFEAPRIVSSTAINDDYQIDFSIWQMQTDEPKVLVNTIYSFSPLGTLRPQTTETSYQEEFEAYTFDVGVTRKLNGVNGNLNLFWGLRMAKVDNELWLGSSDGSLESKNEITGGGFMAGISGREQVKSGINAYLFYHVRGSLLYGEYKNKDQIATFSEYAIGSVNRPISARPIVYEQQANNFESILIGEAMLGLEMDYKLFGKPSRSYIRAMVEYQNWEAEIGYSNEISFSQPFFHLQQDDIIKLLGFSITTGFSW